MQPQNQGGDIRQAASLAHHAPPLTMSLFNVYMGVKAMTSSSSEGQMMKETWVKR
jgi:hypothetical protein